MDREQICDQYLQLMEPLGRAFGQALADPRVHCTAGCSQCCVLGFEISSLDQLLVQSGLAQNPALMDALAHAERSGLLAHECPCPFLDAQGACRIYAWRPQPCRLHGLDWRDSAGALVIDGCCERNRDFCREASGASAIDFAALNAGEDRLYAQANLREVWMPMEQALRELLHDCR